MRVFLNRMILSRCCENHGNMFRRARCKIVFARDKASRRLHRSRRSLEKDFIRKLISLLNARHSIVDSVGGR